MARSTHVAQWIFLRLAPTVEARAWRGRRIGHRDQRRQPQPFRPQPLPNSLGERRGQEAGRKRAERRRRGPAMPPHLWREELDSTKRTLSGISARPGFVQKQPRGAHWATAVDLLREIHTVRCPRHVNDGEKQRTSLWDSSTLGPHKSNRALRAARLQTAARSLRPRPRANALLRPTPLTHARL
jgi:hypothetical protein